MTDTRPELTEKAAKAMADDWNPERDPILTAMFRDYAQTALAAVEADIKAEALREAADDINARRNGPELIAAADKWGGYYSGIRVAMENEEFALRARADALEVCCPHPKCPGGSLCCCADALAPSGRAEGECPETGLHRELCAHCDDALEAGRSPDLPLHRTEAGYPNCSTCDGGGCLDCTDPA